MAVITLVGDCCTQDVSRHLVRQAVEFAAGSDLLILNLEGPAVDWLEPRYTSVDRLRRWLARSTGNKQPVLRTQPQDLAQFAACRSTVATLANNHILDYGEPAVTETLRQLRATGIVPVGAGPTLADALQPVVVTAGPYRIGVASYNSITARDLPPSARHSLFTVGLYSAWRSRPGGAALARRHARRDLRRLKEECDLVIVGLHIGRVGEDSLRRWHIERIRLLWEAGADIVAVHHAHVAHEPIGDRGKCAIGLGDFVFPSQHSSEGPHQIAQVALDDGQVSVRVSSLPWAEGVRLRQDAQRGETTWALDWTIGRRAR